MNHIVVFCELTTGKLKNLLSNNFIHNDVLSVVKSVNSKILFKNIPVSENNAIVENFNCHTLGYKSVEDYTISTSTGKTPEFLNINITSRI